MARVSAVLSSGNVLIDSLLWGTRWGSGLTKTVINVGFSTVGGLSPSLREISALNDILKKFEAVINVDLNFVGNAATHAADIVFKFQNNANSPYYGTGEPPGEGGADGSTVTIQRGNYKGGVDSTLKPGSFDYFILLHEFSHAMGLSHPHLDDGDVNATAFPGVASSYRSLGDYGLNQTVYTAMSYNSGWNSTNIGHVPSSKSNAAGPMALDIAALQYIYGANTNAALGDTVYYLTDQVAQSTYFAIWDAGGRDTISAQGLGASRIDLRSATVEVKAGGGGFVSYSYDKPGALTIAKGAVIENARGGDSNDVLIGNSARNVLAGGNGRDILYGREGNDIFDFNRWTDSNGSAVDVIRDFAQGDRIDLRSIDASWVRSFDQNFVFKGKVAKFSDDGQVRFAYSGDDTLIYLNFDNDQTAESVIRLSGRHALDKYDFIL